MGHFLTRSPLHLGASRASADTVQVNNSEMWSDEMLSGHMSVKTSFPVSGYRRFHLAHKHGPKGVVGISGG